MEPIKDAVDAIATWSPEMEALMENFKTSPLTFSAHRGHTEIKSTNKHKRVLLLTLSI
jgi:hypothetical protein